AAIAHDLEFIEGVAVVAAAGNTLHADILSSDRLEGISLPALGAVGLVDQIFPIFTVVGNLELILFAVSSFPEDVDIGQSIRAAQIDHKPFIIGTSGGETGTFVAINSIFRT